MTDVHLGFEIGTGAAIEVPLRHMVVVGQTQESGKTTTLEALVTRAKVTALAFVTKRGETSFGRARRVQPYFRDRADWQFVTSIIDATLQEKNKFLRPWIMRICRNTESLADVQREVRKALEKATGINEGVYTQLDAYLDLIVPEIARTPLAATLELGPGLNVMDLSASPTPMQMLFVQSALDWINAHAKHVVVVIPEAWEFVPEGKGSPVKASAIDLVRKGAALGNFIWVDSQDTAGVDKTILRGCAVWLIGVQREANEIKRNLANIPAGIKKPSAAEVATLERGQFFACWGRHAVKVYVQPTWLSHQAAREVAQGERVVAPPPPQRIEPEDPTVTKEEAERLSAENAALRSTIARLEERLASYESAHAAAPAPVPPRANATNPAGEIDIEALYQTIKARLVKDAPAIVRVLAARPEIEVQVERKTATIDGTSLKGRVARLIASGFFDEARKQSPVRGELKRTGSDVNDGTLYRNLQEFVKDGFLTNESDKSYRAVDGMKVNVIDRSA